MKINYRKAFNKLKAIGAPVIEGGWNGEDTFRISGEYNDEKIWADYWNQNFGHCGISHEIEQILTEHDLFAEWINGGVLGVYEI